MASNKSSSRAHLPKTQEIKQSAPYNKKRARKCIHCAKGLGYGQEDACPKCCAAKVVGEKRVSPAPQKHIRKPPNPPAPKVEFTRPVFNTTLADKLAQMLVQQSRC